MAVSGAQVQANITVHWERDMRRLRTVREEVKALVEDPQFDVLVAEPRTVYPRPNTYSPELTILNSATVARELLGYITGVMEEYVARTSAEADDQPQAAHCRVFVGHGHNLVVRDKVVSFIKDSCSLDPLVLQTLPSEGATIIEKLERYGRTADYAVLIFTGDDQDTSGAVRARPNVVQECGWFQGALGRGRTAILVQRGVQVPSNLSGVVYIEFTGDLVEQKFDDLRREFRAAGLLPPA